MKHVIKGTVLKPIWDCNNHTRTPSPRVLTLTLEFVISSRAPQLAEEWVVEYYFGGKSWALSDPSVGEYELPLWLEKTNDHRTLLNIENATAVGKRRQSEIDTRVFRIRNVRTEDTIPVAIL